MQNKIEKLNSLLDGEIHADRAFRTIYSTDASIYQQRPLAVAFPKCNEDIAKLIGFANENSIGLIPRTAGTSLAGQVVGSGMVVDVSRYLTKIIKVDSDAGTVAVQPGVIRDELNMELAKHNLYFAPETSTSNRAMIGGMLGNNSCGANSIVYGSTRDHVVKVDGFLSDGSFASFGPTDKNSLLDKLKRDDLQGSIYRTMVQRLSDPGLRARIVQNFPDAEVRRRNTGYAVDSLLDMEPFRGTEPLNLCKLIAGSEGTLFLATQITLNCVPLPAKHSLLICAHFKSVHRALLATQIAMRFHPSRCELIDDLVIAGASRNSALKRKMAFLSGQPRAVLMIEFRAGDDAVLNSMAQNLIQELRDAELGYCFPVLTGVNADSAWQVRKAGLGVVNNVIGDKKPTTLIEDTAVSLKHLPDFVQAIDAYLESEHTVSCVHYGHAGAGEIHLRPQLNLKLLEDRQRLRAIAVGAAEIVKKFRGSLSGEHGDGLLRSELIREMVGEECYALFREIKQTWDPNHIFNPGKITDAARLDQNLRTPSSLPEQPQTVFNFSESGSLLAAVELCSGSGDCRKTHLAGGTMCPSYMATRNEYDTTRARANMLRDLLTNSNVGAAFEDAQAVEDVRAVMDLCLSCKGCKSECPSNVDMAKIKAEFMHGYHQKKRLSLMTRMIADFDKNCQRISRMSFASSIASSSIFSPWIKGMAGIHPNRSLPRIAKENFRQRLSDRTAPVQVGSKGRLILFVDEFTNWLDVDVGVTAVGLLEKLGYEVNVVKHSESGRSAISCGLLDKAKEFAEKNVATLSPLVGETCKLVGVEPSALLTLRDEYSDLVSSEFRASAIHLAEHTLLIDEFLASEFRSGRLAPSVFKPLPQRILLHGHCHQKALSDFEDTIYLLKQIPDAEVDVLDSGCCGMAGFFGYQKDKYELSMQVGELVLLPAVREASGQAIIITSGFSCRQQIYDGTGRTALHPVEILAQNLTIPVHTKN